MRVPLGHGAVGVAGLLLDVEPRVVGRGLERQRCVPEATSASGAEALVARERSTAPPDATAVSEFIGDRRFVRSTELIRQRSSLGA